MVFPVNRSLGQLLSAAAIQVSQARNAAGQLSILFSTETVSANQLISLYTSSIEARRVLTLARDASGMGQYAKDQMGDAALDLATEINSVLSALSAVGTWINDNFPKDATGHILKDKLAVDGVNVRKFTVAQLSGIIPLLDILATA